MKKCLKVMISFILSCILISVNCITGISYYELPYRHNIDKEIHIDEYCNVKFRGIYYNIYSKDSVCAFYPFANGDTLKMPDEIEFKGKKYKVNDVFFDSIEEYSHTLPSKFTVPYKTIYLPKYTTFFDINDKVKLPNLRKIYIPKNIDDLHCLSDMPKLKVIIDKKNPYIKMKNGAVYSKNGKILYNLINSKKTYKIAKETKSIFFGKNNTVKKVILPSSVKKLEIGAFRRCFKLKTVKLNKELKVIEGWAFEKCKSFKKITIPENVKKIDGCAFKECKELSKVTLKSEVKTPKIINDAFKNTKDGIQFVVKNQTVADKLKEQLQNNKSGVKNAKILIGKKVVYQNING